MLPPFLRLPQALPLLPAGPGSYILCLRLEHAAPLRAGRLGDFTLPAGTYFYCGSAFGPGGLRARVLRHARPGGKLHWHIDALREVADLVAVAWQVQVRAECAWSQVLASRPGARVPIPGFGASDCQLKCPAHLVWAEFDPKSIITPTHISV
jgi:Uri superfamily endonuclease